MTTKKKTLFVKPVVFIDLDEDWVEKYEHKKAVKNVMERSFLRLVCVGPVETGLSLEFQDRILPETFTRSPSMMEREGSPS